MDRRRLAIRGGLLVGVGPVLILGFEGVNPVPHIGMLLSVAGGIALLAVVFSSILD